MALRVYDWMGRPQPLSFLKKFGQVIMRDAEAWYPKAELVELRERPVRPPLGVPDPADPAEVEMVMRVRLLNDGGRPLPGARLAWYWPNAPEDRRCGPVGGVPEGMISHRAVWGVTNEQGYASFGVGKGSYYPPDLVGRGPHAAWVYGMNSALIFGLGLLEGTPGMHLEPTFQMRVQEPETPPANFDPMLAAERLCSAEEMLRLVLRQLEEAF